MSVADAIKSKLESGLSPVVLHIENESHMHGGPATESHYKLTVVSEQFAAMSRVQRHQAVYKILAEELHNGVHALALHLFAPEEWEQEQSVPDSPECRGGSAGRQ